MIRRVKRHRSFNLTLEVPDDEFIRPPRDAQRNWLLTRSLKELSDDLEALHERAKDFIEPADGPAFVNRAEERLSDEDIMEDWQIPLMEAMAGLVTDTQGDVLEIGFGRGIAATFVQEQGVRSHTIIECNDSVIERFHSWQAALPGPRDVRMVPGMWQDVIGGLGQFDGILFHTYPLTTEEHVELVTRSTTFAAHFFPFAARHLRPGGRFTYMTNEIDSLSRGHQRALLEYFSAIRIEPMRGLKVPRHSRDAQWSDRTILVQAIGR